MKYQVSYEKNNKDFDVILHKTVTITLENQDEINRFFVLMNFSPTHDTVVSGTPLYNLWRWMSDNQINTRDYEKIWQRMFEAMKDWAKNYKGI